MSRTSFDALLAAGAQFGHLKRKWNPAMAPYIFMERNGIHIIDLNKTVAKVDQAAEALKQIAKSGKKILFVGTKKQAAEVVAEEVIAEEAAEDATAEEETVEEEQTEVQAEEVAAEEEIVTEEPVAAEPAKKASEKKAAAKVEKAMKKPAAKAKAAKLTIEIQSPMGGSITPEEIAAKIPKDTTNVYVRIDENKLYWVKKNGETGSVEIWN